MSGIEMSSWLLWGAAAVVMALIYSGIYGGWRMLAYNLVVSFIGTLGGGWIATRLFGDDSRSELIITVLCAVLLGSVALYLVNRFVFDHEEDEFHHDHQY